MAYAPSQPGIVSEREFSLIADGLFNGELDERAARLAEKEREQQREFNLLTDEVERLRLFNEELDLRAERMDRRGRDLAHAMEMRAAELDVREESLWNEQRAFHAEMESAKASLLTERREFEEYAHHLQTVSRQCERGLEETYQELFSDLRQRETAVTAREQLQRGREAELAHWQSSLEAREDELATAQAQLGEERDAVERQRRRLDEIEHLNSPPVSPPPEGDF